MKKRWSDKEKPIVDRILILKDIRELERSKLTKEELATIDTLYMSLMEKPVELELKKQN
jgi:hypothetical protein